MITKNRRLEAFKSRCERENDAARELRRFDRFMIGAVLMALATLGAWIWVAVYFSL